jgi:capsular exopolysaccharide synthesis family protein
MAQADAHILSQAKIPVAPSSPKIMLNLAIGLILALAAGLGAIILFELLENGLSTTEDVERYLQMPNLASIPLLKSRHDDRPMPRSTPAGLVVDKPLSAFAEAFRNLRTSVLTSRPGERVKIVAITSSLPGEGKTTTSIALGRTMAVMGGSVVVVECDLRHPAFSRVLDHTSDIGLLQVLTGSASLDAALVKDKTTSAVFLPVAAGTYTPGDIFGTDAMDHLLGELGNRFDVVLLDTPPVLALADTRSLASKADVVLYLVRWRKTARHAVEAGLKQLESVGAYVAGIALSQVDAESQSRGAYGDGEYYRRAYQQYYLQ